MQMNKRGGFLVPRTTPHESLSSLLQSALTLALVLRYYVSLFVVFLSFVLSLLCFTVLSWLSLFVLFLYSEAISVFLFLSMSQSLCLIHDVSVCVSTAFICVWSRFVQCLSSFLHIHTHTHIYAYTHTCPHIYIPHIYVYVYICK